MQKKIREYFAKPGKTIGEHADDLLRQAEILWKMGYIKNGHIYYLLKEACIHHDDGKANPQFERRLKEKNKFFNPDKEISHNILSIFYLNPEEYAVKEDYLVIACAILYHHNYCNEAEVIKEKEELIQHLLINEYAVKLKRGDRNKILGNMILNPRTILVKGFLHRCDYSASGNYQIEYPNNFLLPCLKQMMQTWREKNAESRWNDLQNFCIKNRDNDVIAVASTGMGKTEAGLQWIGNHKGFFILPIRTAINAIYDRVKNEILHNENLNERLALLHSEALGYYGVNTEEMDIMEYYDRGKRLSLPLNISTMDQLFDFVFKIKGYEMKLVTLSCSKLVIDEIQMYGPDLLAYLICGIQQIHQLGGKIAIVTATLPPFIRDMLKHDAGVCFQEAQFTSDGIRHSVLVKNESLSVDDILKCYHDNIIYKRSNKILVVCNTIRKAQLLYDCLREADANLDTHIFHSRFTKADRKRLEEEIRSFGRTYQSDEGDLDMQNGIWIATSLVEVSLDIDFDYLFTELSELNALFQRMGRCNRKGKKEIVGYNCFVYCDGSDVKHGKKGFVDAVLYKCSKEALQQVNGLLSEKEKINLVNEYFTTKRVSESEFMRVYRDKLVRFRNLHIGEFEEEESVKLRTISTCDIIPKPVYDRNCKLIKDIEDQLKETEWEIRQILGDGQHVPETINRLYRHRIDLQERLKSFIVTIPKYEFDKKIPTYGTIEVNKYIKVPIIDCHYDEKGYYPLSYDEREDKYEIMIF